jgi:hypothetical protein
MIALNLKQNLLSIFYSILSYDALPTCQVEEQDDNHNKIIYNTNKLKEGVLNGFIPSAFVDSAATSSVGTKEGPIQEHLYLNDMTVQQGVPYAKQSSGGGNSNGQTPP